LTIPNTRTKKCKTISIRIYVRPTGKVGYIGNMDSIFDFEKMYAGVIQLDEKTFPCTLSFKGSLIKFKLIGSSTREHREGKHTFSGYVSTERGIMNYRALNALHTSWTSGSNDLNNQEFQADELLLGNLSQDIDLGEFQQVNICYNHLERIGRFVTLDQDEVENLDFKFKRLFETILFCDDNWGKLTLENPVRYHFSNTGLQYFRLNIDPFFSFIPKNPITLEEVQLIANQLGWFTQLIFGIRQQPIDIVLFQHPQNNGHSSSNEPFFYLAPELIQRKINKITANRHPTVELEGLKESLAASFQIWNNFTAVQRKLYILYFNEINSRQYIADDRFKNLCAIVQGLDALGNTKIVSNVKGEMNSKLRRATTPELEQILIGHITIPSLHRLYEVIGNQRDHFQHLSKPLHYDLCEDMQEMHTVNILLEIIIRHHLFTSIKLPAMEAEKIIKGDISWIQRKLKKLQAKITERYKL